MQAAPTKITPEYGSPEFVERVKTLRAAAIERNKPYTDDRTEFTCENCRDALTCEFSFDGYNTNGDCLAEK